MLGVSIKSIQGCHRYEQFLADYFAGRIPLKLSRLVARDTISDCKESPAVDALIGVIIGNMGSISSILEVLYE
ncbi:TPA: hypothetical protein HA241_06025 [Candidatus Woesearchaeota archaeon]|nr:hypothetical protein [Candidatus Woesearchaeota archaeon]